MNAKTLSGNVSIKVTGCGVEANVNVSDCEKNAYIEKYLTRTNDTTPAKVYVTPEIHRILSLMAGANTATGATISGYVTRILTDHFAKNAHIMHCIFEDNREVLF